MSGAFDDQFAAADTTSPLQNIEAEIGLLGDLIADNRLIDAVAEHCRARDFAVPLHGRVFDKMLEQSLSGTVDAVTLSPHFSSEGDWPRLFNILSAASLNAGPRARTRAYFEQLVMLSGRRRLVAGLEDVVSSARNLQVPREELLANADEAVAAMADQITTAQDTVGNYAQGVIATFGQPIVGVRCGLIGCLDDAIGVLRPSNICVVGGRPGMGKTSLVTSYAIGAASRGHGVLIFSLEMSADELTCNRGCPFVLEHRMAHTCSECGATRHSTYTRGTLIARDFPFEIYRDGRLIHLTPSQAVVAYELVRFGRISRDRIFALAVRAERGAVESLAAVRIGQIKERLAAAGAEERITSIRGYGYQLEIA